MSDTEHIKLLRNCFNKWKHFYHDEILHDDEILHEMWCRYVEEENERDNYWSREADRWWAAETIQYYWRSREADRWWAAETIQYYWRKFK